MPDHRKHRGPNPEDRQLFTAAWLKPLQQATTDLSWLLSRGYASPSAMKIVGDRYNLSARQRIAVMRCACPDQARLERARRVAAPKNVAGKELRVDGYNVLTTVEAALAGGVILAARDRTYRDLASMHGTWRHVEETSQAIAAIARTLLQLGIGRCTWFLDAPVSNSGRLKQTIAEAAKAAGWDWTVEVVPDPDKILVQPAAEGELVATADSVVLDRCGQWLNLARLAVEQIPGAWVVPMATEINDVGP